MNRRQRFLVTIAALGAVLLGFLSGAASSSTTFASGWAEYWFDVPVRTNGSTDAKITCGWHWGSCPSNPGGGALDWGYLGWNNIGPNLNVYLRGAGFHPDYSTAGLTYAHIRDAPGEFTNCHYNVIADIYDTATNGWYQSLGYTHTFRTTSTIKRLWYGQFFPYSNYTIARMENFSDPSDPGCPGAWTAPHVHFFSCDCSPYGPMPRNTGLPAAPAEGGPYSTATWNFYFAFWY